MSWFELLPTAVVFAVVLVVPGALVVRGLSGSTWLALGAGPAVSAAFYGLLTVVFARTGVDWAPAPVAGAAALVAAVAWAGGWWLRRRPGGRDADVSSQEWQTRGRDSRPALVSSTSSARRLAGGLSWRAWMAVVVFLGVVITVVPIALGMGAPDAPLQQWDAVYHLNGVALVQESGDASNLNGLYGVGVTAYYPTVWHAMVSLTVSVGGPLTASSITAAANASTLVIASLGWLLGIAAFARAVFPRRPGTVVVAVSIGAAFSMFPTVMLSTLAQWPNGLSVMLIPGAAALVVHAVRLLSTADRAAKVHGCVVGALALVGVVGVGLTQASGVVGLAVVVGPCVVTAVFLWFRRAWRDGRRAMVLGLLGGAAVLGAGALVVVLQSPALKTVFAFERASQRSYVMSVPRTVFDIVLSPVPGNLVLTAAVVLGAVLLLRARADRWIVVSAVLVVLLAALAAGPDNPLRALTGVWYTQAARIEGLYPVVAVLLAAVGLVGAGEWLAGRLRPRLRAGGWLAWIGQGHGATAALVLLAFVASFGFQAPQRAERFAQAYEPGKIMWGTMLSAEEIDLMRRLPDLVPEGSLILGDPFNGAPFAWSIGQRHVVFPQLNVSGLDPDRRHLLTSFRDIASDPRVCEAVRNLGVTHFYEDTAGEEDGAKPNPGGEGLRDVDASVGLEVVATAGSATLFRLTACG